MYPLFSGNSHVVEPPDVFSGRMDKRWEDKMPRLVDRDDGGQMWVFEDGYGPLHRTCCLGGALDEPAWRTDVENFHKTVSHRELRPGCYDAKQRVQDMDADGIAVAVSISHPSGMGFASDLFTHTKDPELSLACVRAWNDWYHEEWIGVAPDRFVPVGCTTYLDPAAAAAEVERNAERGFRGITFRNPPDLGLPWFGTGHWDPLLRACEDTQTVIVHHTEGLPWFPRRELPGGLVGYPYGMTLSLYQACAMDFVTACLWSGLSVRFPNLKIMVAESGGSWLPHLLRRLNFTLEHSVLTRQGWPDFNQAPLEMIRRTFAFSTQELDVARDLEQDLGITAWLMEDDYPHIESAWPNTAKQFEQQTSMFEPSFTERLAWKNGSELFRFPMPPGSADG
jgi:predicted TIM-barrel fold metal-dependent hydrolase